MGIKGHRGGSMPGNYIKNRLAPTLRPSMVQIAWAAGVYEGEGCCQVTGAKAHPCTALAICQKDPWILYRLRDYFGGSVYTLRSRSLRPDGSEKDHGTL